MSVDAATSRPAARKQTAALLRAPAGKTRATDGKITARAFLAWRAARTPTKERASNKSARQPRKLPARKVPAPWDSLPVTPARLRWRVRRGDRTVRPWHAPIDFGKELLPQEDFRRIYAPGTRQNRQGKPGLYRFYLAHTWSTTLLDDGHYGLEVEASDLRGNKGRLHLPFTLINDL